MSRRPILVRRTPPTRWDQRCVCGHLAVRHTATEVRALAGGCQWEPCECKEFDLSGDSDAS